MIQTSTSEQDSKTSSAHRQQPTTSTTMSESKFTVQQEEAATTAAAISSSSSATATTNSKTITTNATAAKSNPRNPKRTLGDRNTTINTAAARSQHRQLHRQQLLNRRTTSSISAHFASSNSSPAPSVILEEASHDGSDYNPKSAKAPTGNRFFRLLCARCMDAKRHGGNVLERLDTAFRAGVGSVAYFSLLKLPDDQNYLGAIWIGAMFFHVCLGNNIGSSIIAVRGFAFSVIFTTLLSWPIALWFQSMDDQDDDTGMMTKKITLPFFTFLLSLGLMLCPWLSFRNLMVLVSFIVIALPVRQANVAWHVPLGFCGSYLVGITFGIIMNIFPWPKRACVQVHTKLLRYEQDACQCLAETKAYTMSTGQASHVARAAISGVGLLVGRMDRTVQELQQLIPAAQEELKWHYILGRPCGRHDQQCHREAVIGRLENWVAHLQKQTLNYHLLSMALKQRFLGEALSSHDQFARDMRIKIATRIQSTYHPLLDAMVDAIQLGTRSADPMSCGPYDDEINAGELESLLAQTRAAFSAAVEEATMLVGENAGVYASKPQLAHLARRMTSFHNLSSIAEDLIDFVEQTRQESKHHEEEETGIFRKFWHSLFHWLCRFPIQTFWQPKWLWHDPEEFHLSLKMSTGMLLGSLFLSVDALWLVANPFGLWPGITVAIVNLPLRGSSFHKASDRLFGTALAAAFAMVVTDIFPDNPDSATIPAIGLFTFVVIYLRNPEHAYKYTYAAMSIGAILIGANQNGIGVPGYIPKRIQLIFLGVFIFAIVELFVFRRSSRKLVEQRSLQVLFDLEAFLDGARSFLTRLDRYTNPTNCDVEHGSGDTSEITTLQSAQLLQCDQLDLFQSNLHQSAAILSREVPSALQEPYFGFSQRLTSGPLMGLSKTSTLLDRQTALLKGAFHRLSEFYQEEEERRSSRNMVGVIRYYDWPKVYLSLLEKAATKIQHCCDNLRVAFPDSRLRPQNDNSLEAIAAAASFRELDSVRLELVSVWSEHFYKMEGCASKPNEAGEIGKSLVPTQVLTLGITISFLLEICRHFQKAGKNLEEYARTFPPHHE